MAGRSSLLSLLGIGRSGFGRRRVAVLILAAFLPLAGASVTGLPGLGGVVPTVDISAVPHLAQALGLTQPAAKMRLVPVPHPQTVAPTPSTTIPAPRPSSQPPSGPPPVVISYGPTGQSGRTLAVGAFGLLPGAVVERSITLVNNGALNISAISLVASTNTSVPLVSNSTEGLRVAVLRCSSTWVPSRLADGGWSFSCPASESATPFVSVASVLAQPIPVVGLSSLRPGGVDQLVVELSFPLSAPISLGGESATINWSFDASAP